MKRRLPIARLKNILHYVPATGELFWLVSFSNRTPIGTRAGTWSHGYIQVGIKGRYYRAHHIIWAFETGRWPKREIDHFDTVRSNNRFSNLREATRRQNCGNMYPPKHNTSGVKGVSWNKIRQKWYAYIGVNNRTVNLGLYEKLDDAALAYAAAAKKHFGEFARAR